jgi:hypothetical protein
MRRILIASLIVAGMGFVGASTTSAAPVNNTVLQQLTDMNNSSNVTQVGWHNRWRSHWRWGSRGGPGGGRCHVRWRSFWRWC